jgi:hypothetical protein
MSVLSSSNAGIQREVEKYGKKHNLDTSVGKTKDGKTVMLTGLHVEDSIRKMELIGRDLPCTVRFIGMPRVELLLFDENTIELIPKKNRGYVQKISLDSSSFKNYNPINLMEYEFYEITHCNFYFDADYIKKFAKDIKKFLEKYNNRNVENHCYLLSNNVTTVSVSIDDLNKIINGTLTPISKFINSKL